MYQLCLHSGSRPRYLPQTESTPELLFFPPANKNQPIDFIDRSLRSQRQCHKRSENVDELKKLNGAGDFKIPVESAIRDPKMEMI
jgi:hypothetical protein